MAGKGERGDDAKMKQNNHLTTQQDKWLKELLALEQVILDGHMPSTEQLLVVPAEIRMKYPCFFALSVKTD